MNFHSLFRLIVMVSLTLTWGISTHGDEFYPTANQCWDGEVRASWEAEEEVLAQVIDDDPGTFISSKGPCWVEVIFRGTHRWINKIQVVQSGEGRFCLNYQDIEGRWQEVGSQNASSTPSAYTFDLSPVEVKAIRWNGDEVEHRLYDLGAWFRQHDPDGDEYEVGVEWVNDYRQSTYTLQHADEDAEWIGLSAGYILYRRASNHSREYWAQCLNGAHLVLGWNGPRLDVDFGRRWANYMIKNSPYDVALPLYQAWFDAAEKTHPRPYKAVVIGEDTLCIEDYLWGEGPVIDDPEVDDVYCFWTYMTWWPPRGPESINLPSEPMVTIPAKSREGMPVKYPPSILSSIAERSMNVYQVIHRVVDAAYVQAVTSSLCEAESLLCGGTMGVDGLGHYWTVDGHQIMEMCSVTAAVNYINAEHYICSSGDASVPSENKAEIQSQTFLQNLEELGYYPSDAYLDETDFVVEWCLNKDPGQQVEECDTVNVRVSYVREIGPYPVAGPGASITVAYGKGGVLAHWVHNGWREIDPGGGIESPADYAWFEEGVPVTFNASAAGGHPPYTFEWTSDVDGYLGSGSPFTTDDLSPFFQDSVWLPHVITLTVTDSCEMTDHVNVHVVITAIDEPSFIRGDAEADGDHDIFDGLKIIYWLGGSEPSLPPPNLSTGCGTDPTPDAGLCETAIRRVAPASREPSQHPPWARSRRVS